MRQALRTLVPLLAAYAALAWGATALLATTQRHWFERDLVHRGEIAVAGVRARLAQAWRAGDRGSVAWSLRDLSRDGRVLAATACTPAGETFAADGAAAPPEACAIAAPALGSSRAWSATVALGDDEVHATAIPVSDDEGPLGHVVVLQEVGFIRAREEATRQFSIAIFAAVAALASVVTVLGARSTWRTWTRELRRLLAGGARRRRSRLEPILGEVKDLAATLAAEQAAGAGVSWSAERLRHTLIRHLHGDRILVLANREPYVHDRGPDGKVRVLHPASGLVTALEPVMRACSGTWVAHGSGSADRETVDAHARLGVPPGEERYVLRRVWLTPEEERGYYYGFANEGLWPLCHVAHVKPAFRSEDFAHYARVNRRFADAVCEEAPLDDPVVLVQDYHYALAPRAIRRRLPRATIIAFWHIPWPNPERLAMCPQLLSLLDGLLGSSIMGFQTQYHCNQFLDAVDRFLEARIDRERQAVVFGGEETLVRPYPISIEWPSHWAAEAPPVADCRRDVRAALGLPADALLGVGVDRLDYTKGIEERLLAVERLLEQRRRFRGRFTFVQLAAPSRTAIPAYQEANRRIEEIAARVNERHGTRRQPAIVLSRAHHEPPDVFRHYRAADLCVVSSLHDGMNLVAKEFVAARDDERGVLVLSRFTGAAQDLPEALLVNPYDLDEAAHALAAALDMPEEEQAERMRAMRAFTAHFNVHRWAGRMLIDAASLRRRGRLVGRLEDNGRAAEGGAG